MKSLSIAIILTSVQSNVARSRIARSCFPSQLRMDLSYLYPHLILRYIVP